MIFGLSIGWEIARRGASVEVVDPFGPGAGASGGLVGALAPHVPESWNPKKQVQFDSLDMAAPFWGAVAAAGGTDPGYARTGRLQPITDAAALELAHARAASAQTLWQGRYLWQVVAAQAFPGLLDSPTGWLIHDTLTARLHPQRACAALVAAIRAKGGRVVAAASAAPMIEIWATGVAGLHEMSEASGRPVGTGVKGQAAAFRAELGAAPQLFAEALHIVPHADGTVAVGSTSERDYDDPAGTDAQLDALIDTARRCAPPCGDAPVTPSAGRCGDRAARSRAHDAWAAPQGGRTRPGAFVANGGFKMLRHGAHGSPG